MPNFPGNYSVVGASSAISIDGTLLNMGEWKLTESAAGIDVTGYEDTDGTNGYFHEAMTTGIRRHVLEIAGSFRRDDPPDGRIYVGQDIDEIILYIERPGKTGPGIGVRFKKKTTPPIPFRPAGVVVGVDVQTEVHGKVTFTARIIPCVIQELIGGS